MSNLKKMHMLSAGRLAGARKSDVEKAIRPSGFYKQKARYLIAFSKHVVAKYRGDIRKMRLRPLDNLRKELLDIPGIGPETADAIILYAIGMPSFVVDAYTFRLLERLGLKPGRDYDSLKARVEDELGNDVHELADMHALIVMHCKTQRTKGHRCGDCCLSAECPSKRE